MAKYDVAGGDGTVNAPVEKEVDLTKVVEDQGDVHVPAHIDEGGGAIGMKPEVDKDGGDLSTPEVKKDGKLGEYDDQTREVCPWRGRWHS